MSDFKLMFEEVRKEKQMHKKDIELLGKIISTRMTPLFDNESKKIIGVVGILQDVTKERKCGLDQKSLKEVLSASVFPLYRFN